jgi:hypothetical protein
LGYLWPLQEGLQIGSHDLSHSAYFRIAHESVHIDASPFAVKTNRFHCRVEAGFIAKLEAVRKRFLGAVYAYAYAVEFMSLHAGTIRFIRKPIDFYWREFQPWYLCASLDSHVNFVGYLGGEFVKRKRRDEANYTTLNPCCYGYKIRISQWFTVGKAIYTTADCLQRTVITHVIKGDGMDARLQRLRCA